MTDVDKKIKEIQERIDKIIADIAVYGQGMFYVDPHWVGYSEEEKKKLIETKLYKVVYGNLAI